MILITRLPEPDVLTRNQAQWLATFLQRKKDRPAARPNARQYGHPEIRNVLNAMSFSKCFYCERKLDDDSEVDHYLDVANHPELAFSWVNLYLSCHDCNRKKIGAIPVDDCLDPCRPTECPAECPADHLTFDDEFIRAKNGSPKGERTFQKYRLDRDELNYARSRHLRTFERILRQLRERQLRDGSRPLRDREIELLTSFKQRDRAFSLLGRVYLAAIDIS